MKRQEEKFGLQIQKIKKLAQENARYLTSVFTPTSMVYSITYRELNIIYRKIEKEIDYLEGKEDTFSKRLRSELIDFNKQLSKLGYIDDKLSQDDKNYVLKLFNRKSYTFTEQFGPCYTLVYNASFAQLAQAQRHRTIDYTISMGKDNSLVQENLKRIESDEEADLFYIPPILKKYGLDMQWCKDCLILAENIPQGLMVPVIERGTFENFKTKLKERNCSCAQLEIDNQTTKSKKKIYENLKVSNPELAEELEPYMKGSRCTFPDYECPSPCGFKEGITGERII